MNEIFKVLDFILKKNKSPVSTEEPPHSFMLNRWLSMSDPSIALIINATTNKWATCRGICSRESFKMTEFLECILPKINKRIQYIKKSTKKNKDLESPDSVLELSNRELKLYNETLDFIKKTSKL